MKPTPQTETWDEFIERRHEWSVAGSSGKFNVVIPKSSSIYDHKKQTG